MSEVRTNQSLISGLRELASFVESNSDIDFPAFMELNTLTPITLNVYSWYADDKKTFIADLVRRLGASEKIFQDSFISVDRAFGPCVKLSLSMERDLVCERVVVGKKEIPAVDELTVPARPAHTEDIVEWKCGSILSLGGAA